MPSGASAQVCDWEGTGGGSVESLAVFNGNLYAGGLFTMVGNTSANHIARWDGSSWTALGNGRNNIVFTMLVFDEDGGGPLPLSLYTGGDFSTAGGVSANNVARWDGSNWFPVGLGTDLGGVNGLAAFNGDLYAVGEFQFAEGNIANRAAMWDGAAWHGLSGPSGNGLNGPAYCALAHNDGSGMKLYVGGVFTTAGGITATRIARWTGTQWEGVGGGMNGSVLALAEYNGELYAGGTFITAGGVTVNRIAKWDGVAWDNVAGGISGTTAIVSTMRAFDDGTGSKLYVGGTFPGAFGVPDTTNLARWNGTAFESVGNGTNGSVRALSPGTPGISTGLFAGGVFNLAGGVDVSCLAVWENPTWSPVGKCVDQDCNNNGVDDAMDIANGDSTDCNENAIPDECDLEDPMSDLNFNGILDECEPDCNGNGLPDDLDIQLGLSDDDNDNGIPDECEGACAGDTNGDNDVDVNDLNNVILDWGTDGSANGGDITGPSPGSPPDGIVNVNDLNAIIVNWGLCPSALVTGVLDEPQTAGSGEQAVSGDDPKPAKSGRRR